MFMMDPIGSFLDTHQAILALCLVALLFIEFARERHPPAVIAAMGAAVFLVFGFLSLDEALDAFSNEAPLTIAAMFVLSGAMVRTGALEALATRLLNLSQTRPQLAITLLLAGAFLGSAFLNNTPVVIVLIPVVAAIAAELGIARKRLLIPLSYIAILGGTLTLIGTSSNLIVDGVTRDLGLEGFGIFEISLVGLIASTVGIISLWAFGRYFLPQDDDLTFSGAKQANELITQISVKQDASVIGKAPSEVKAFGPRGVDIIRIIQSGETFKPNADGLTLKTGDKIDVRLTEAELLTLTRNRDFDVGLKRRVIRSAETDTAAITVRADSPDVGVPVSRASFLSRFPIEVIGAARPGHLAGPNLADMVLRPGDRLYVQTDPSGMNDLQDSTFILAPGQMLERAFRRDRLILAVIALLSVVILAAFGVMPIAGLALIAAAALLFLRCIDPGEAWQSVEGDVLVLIFAMLMIGTGLQNTGTVDLIVSFVRPALIGAPPFLAILGVYFLTSVLTELVTNNAVAVLMTPIAIALSASLGVDAKTLIVAVMFAASASFATPVGYQTNTLVYSAGNYRFADFLRIGLPMNLIVGLATCGAIYWIF